MCVFLFTGTQKAEENGEDYDRVKLLDKTADELERMEKKRKKKNPDEGFSGLDHIWWYVILYILIFWVQESYQLSFCVPSFNHYGFHVTRPSIFQFVYLRQAWVSPTFVSQCTSVVLTKIYGRKILGCSNHVVTKMCLKSRRIIGW